MMHPAMRNNDETFPLPASIVGNPESAFLMKIHDDVMASAGLMDGDAADAWKDDMKDRALGAGIYSVPGFAADDREPESGEIERTAAGDAPGQDFLPW